MKRYLLILAIIPFLYGCVPTRIVTVSPHTDNVYSYSTTVTMPRTRTMTTTTSVYPADSDISLYLDLQAVAAAFAQSSSVEEFENLLNNSQYMLSNLDLNRDGYVDYLRVLETLEGHTHVFLIQAVLDEDIYQDVATLVAETPSYTNYHIQVIGAPYIYGPKFIIEPVFYTRPLILDHFLRPFYRPWFSPWHWKHFPPHYRHPAPIIPGHYRAYIDTYMRNHMYCHEFRYADAYHFMGYERICRPLMRNDYGKKYPERSFTVRTANIPNNNNSRIVNARDIRERQAASTNTKVTTSTRSASTASSSATSSPSASSVRRASTSTGTTRTSAGSGTTNTVRSAGSTGTGSSPARTSSSSSNQTTVKSRVNTSGTSDTRIRTVSPSGSESTVKRGSTSTATRSTGASATSTTRSSTSATRSSATSATRSSSTSTTRSSATSATRSSSPSSSTSRSASAGSSGSANRRK